MDHGLYFLQDYFLDPYELRRLTSKLEVLQITYTVLVVKHIKHYSI